MHAGEAEVELEEAEAGVFQPIVESSFDESVLRALCELDVRRRPPSLPALC